MTDLQKFIDLYKSFGIELKPEEVTEEDYFPAAKTVLVMRSNPYLPGRSHFDGYNKLFYSTVFFDANGKFIKQGFWE